MEAKGKVNQKKKKAKINEDMMINLWLKSMTMLVKSSKDESPL